MPWVQRDTGVIVAMFAREQPGTAEEFVTPLTYVVSTELPGGAVNVTRLEQEIRASDIATNLFRCWANGDTLNILFDGTLSAGDLDLLQGVAYPTVGGLLAAHDNSVTPSVAPTLVVEADPEISAVNAPVGTKIVWGHRWYCKEDNGLSNNVAFQGHTDIRAGEAGGSTLNLVAFPADPTMVAGDSVLVAQSGIIEHVYYDGAKKHLLAQSKDADVGQFFVADGDGGAVDIITPGAFENLFKGSTLSDGDLLGGNWAVVNAGTDTVGFKYIGERTRLFKIELDVNFTSDEDGNIYEIQYAKNDTKDAKSFVKAECVIGADGVLMHLPFADSLAKDDVVSFMIDSDLQTPIVTVRTAPILVTPL